jgi:hypothetical protein
LKIINPAFEETMTGWLESWGEGVPDSIMGGNDHGAMDHGDMPGMMSEEQMATLEDASGAEFDELFLRMMIEHHEGAIEMAQIEQADGESFREIVRQQWNFSPSGSTSEVEDYAVALACVSALELRIVPDTSGGDVRASLAALRLA